MDVSSVRNKIFWFFEERRILVFSLIGAIIAAAIAFVIWNDLAQKRAERNAFNYLLATQKMERFQKAEAKQLFEDLYTNSRGIYAVLAGRDLFEIAFKAKKYDEAVTILDSMASKTDEGDAKLIAAMFIGSSLVSLKPHITPEDFAKKVNNVINIAYGISIKNNSASSLKEEFIASMYLEVNMEDKYAVHIKKAYALQPEDERLAKLVQNIV